MLCFASAQDRTDPRRIKGYFNANGFDPLVVPTMVDHGTGEIIADSRLIALHADDVAGAGLVPALLADAVSAEMDAVDATPHAALLYGANPDGDGRPEAIRRGMSDAHLAKIARIEHRIAQPDLDLALLEAYRGKLAKERQGLRFVSDAYRMRAAVGAAAQAVRAFGERLGGRHGDWILGDRFTLADVFWGVSLFRLQYLGFEWMWRSDAATSAFADRAFNRPSLKAAVIDWPGHPPGPGIPS